MNNIKYIVQKELHRVFSERKLIFSLFILPAVLMVGIMAISSNMALMKSDDIEQHIPIVYVQNEPSGFTEFVEQCQVKAEIITVKDSSQIDQIKNDIIEGNIELLYIFDESFLEEIANYTTLGRLPSVEEYYNSSKDYSSAAQATFAGVFKQFEHSILVNRFGDESAITAFHMKSQVILNEEKASGQLLGRFIPYFLSILMFAGAMGLAIDALAGEKERGTLASMLLTPAKRSEIALGKIISLIILSGLSSLIYIVIMVGAFPVMFGDQDLSGLSISFTPIQIVQLIILLLCMVFLYVAIISLAAILAKDVKTASSYISPVYILIMVIGLVSMFGGEDQPAHYMYLIPLYGNSLAIQNIMTQSISLGDYFINLASTVLISIFLLRCMTSAFNSEKIIFNA